MDPVSFRPLVTGLKVLAWALFLLCAILIVRAVW